MLSLYEKTKNVEPSYFKKLTLPLNDYFQMKVGLDILNSFKFVYFNNFSNSTFTMLKFAKTFQKVSKNRPSLAISTYPILFVVGDERTQKRISYKYFFLSLEIILEMYIRMYFFCSFLMTHFSHICLTFIFVLFFDRRAKHYVRLSS